VEASDRGIGIIGLALHCRDQGTKAPLYPREAPVPVLAPSRSAADKVAACLRYLELKDEGENGLGEMVN
jgi:hypothetical protein